MNNQKNAWDNLYSKGLTWKKASKGLFSLRGKSVLELGVGNGKTLRAIIENNPGNVVAIDISKEAIKLSKNIGKNIDFVKSDIFDFNTKEKFDVIFCYYFLNNFKEKDRIKVIQKIGTILKKDGIILFEDFGNKDFRKQKGEEIEKNTIQKENGILCHFFTKKELKELFNDFNIEIEEKTFKPIRKNNAIKRHIINAIIHTQSRTR